MGRLKGGKNKIKKEIPLSKESKKLVEKGLQEAKEGKLERINLDELISHPDPVEIEGTKGWVGIPIKGKDKCLKCNGTGHIGNKCCKSCNGEGNNKLTIAKRESIKTPPLCHKLLKSRKEDSQKEEIDPIMEQSDANLPEKEISINPELKKTINELTKQFGHEIIHFASEEPERERIPTGIPELDKMITGFPAGAFSVIWGNKGSTKSTTALYLIAQAQKLGKTCLYLDLETSFDNSWADKCGIDRSKLLIGHFDNAEEGLDTAIKMSREKVIDVIILDSVQSLSPEGEQETKKGEEKSTGDDTMALLARRLSQFFRMDASGNYKGNVTFILIGQSRMDLGGYIKLEKLSGGKALAHWATLIIKTYRATKADSPIYKFKIGEKNKSFPIGFSICYRLEKKKISGTAPEETEVRTNFYNEFGFKKPTDKEIVTLYADWIAMEAE
jgi:RecA/RadA recombinase